MKNKKIIYALVVIYIFISVVFFARAYFRYVRLADANSLKGGLVSLNFDDGFESAYKLALPIIEKDGFKTTQYIVTNYIGMPGYVTKDQVLEMYKNGNEIGAHTRNHVHLSSVSPEKAKNEILGSKQDLEKMGIEPVTFAYPYGDYNDSVVKEVEDAGFISARTTKPEFNDQSSDKFLLKRQRVEQTTTFGEIKKAIDDSYDQNKWLILVFHRIDDGNNPVSVSSGLVRQIADYLVKKGIRVVTNEEALAILKNDSLKK